MQAYQTHTFGKYAAAVSRKRCDGYKPHSGKQRAQIAQGDAGDADRDVREYLQAKHVWINTGARTGNAFVLR